MDVNEVIRTVKSLAAKHVGSATTQVVVLPTTPANVADEVEDANLPEPPPWPVLGDAARHGIVGDYLRAIEDSTEADPAGILVSKLVAFGNCVGRGPRFLVEGDYHHCNEYVVTVGKSAKGRKGTGLGRSTALLQNADPEWHEKQIASGLSSGEGVIWLVRDPIERSIPVKDKRDRGRHRLPDRD